MLLAKYTGFRAAEGVDLVQGTPEFSLQLPGKPMVSCLKELILLETTARQKWDCFSPGSVP